MTRVHLSFISSIGVIHKNNYVNIKFLFVLLVHIFICNLSTIFYNYLKNRLFRALPRLNKYINLHRYYTIPKLFAVYHAFDADNSSNDNARLPPAIYTNIIIIFL